jgi:hypothetical protein
VRQQLQLDALDLLADAGLQLGQRLPVGRIAGLGVLSRQVSGG